jgi:hypothetical protein
MEGKMKISITPILIIQLLAATNLPGKESCNEKYITIVCTNLDTNEKKYIHPIKLEDERKADELTDNICKNIFPDSRVRTKWFLWKNI